MRYKKTSSDIPDDLVEQAVERLGKYEPLVRTFVHRANQVKWLAQGGKPGPWDREIVHAHSFEEAFAKNQVFVEVSDTVWDSLGVIGKSLGRFDVMMSAEEYWIGTFDYPGESGSPYYLAPNAFDVNMIGCLREIILDDVISIRFFREHMEWYERGHWLCAINENGERVVW